MDNMTFRSIYITVFYCTPNISKTYDLSNSIRTYLLQLLTNLVFDVLGQAVAESYHGTPIKHRPYDTVVKEQAVGLATV